jgi:hypothetical protein
MDIRLRIEIEPRNSGWVADIQATDRAKSYGATRGEALLACQARALRAIADQLEQPDGERAGNLVAVQFVADGETTLPGTHWKFTIDDDAVACGASSREAAYYTTINEDHFWVASDRCQGCVAAIQKKAEPMPAWGKAFDGATIHVEGTTISVLWTGLSVGYDQTVWIPATESNSNAFKLSMPEAKAQAIAFARSMFVLERDRFTRAIAQLDAMGDP